MTDRPLRILEFGYPLFKTALPDSTDFFWADRKRGQGPLFGPSAFFKVLPKLRRGEYDLVSIATPGFAPWHPRAFLTALRDHHIRSPQALFAMNALETMHGLHKVPVAAIDIRDSFGIPASNLRLLDRSTAYFKRELPADAWASFYKTTHWGLPGARWRSKPTSQGRIAKLKPISLGYFPVPYEPDIPKTADVFFSGDVFPNSTVRAEGIEELLSLRDDGIVVDIPDGRLAPGEFRRRLAGAWLGWSPAGFGWDCYRHYEAAALGTVPLINYPTVKRYQPMVDGEHCLFYAVEPGGLARAVRGALAAKDRLIRIAVQARAHVTAHHSFEARARYVAVSVLGRDLDGRVVGDAP